MPHDPASRAAEAIVDLLSGPLEECGRALNAGELSRASYALTAAVDQLRRIRRELSEEAERDS